jgi:hypothetical protein
MHDYLEALSLPPSAIAVEILFTHPILFILLLIIAAPGPPDEGSTAG